MLQRQGIVPEILGTVAVLLGIYFIIDAWNTPLIGFNLKVGALFVFGGLLLRIEAAIRNVRN